MTCVGGQPYDSLQSLQGGGIRKNNHGFEGQEEYTQSSSVSTDSW